MKILILCKVVDNFGDIGFCYRLARSLVAHGKSIDVSLVVSDLKAFSKMARGIDFQKPFQVYKGFDVFDWNAEKLCKEHFLKNLPEIILECFQCNRPEWLDEILETTETKTTILNIDYLTAEDYAEDFHLLKSAIRFPNMKKYFFMDGFSPKTAGLILDGMEEPKNNAENSDIKNDFIVTVFSYEQNFSPIVKALSSFQSKSGKKVLCKVASGKSEEPFLKAWKEEGKPFEIEILPFLEQEEWDDVVYGADFNFIRGEDSLTRACLAGVPFLWHAYPQDENYQLVKTEALLKKIEPPPYFKSLFQNYNETNRTEEMKMEIEEGLLMSLLNYAELKPIFSSFTERLKKIGNFTENLISAIMEKL